MKSFDTNILFYATNKKFENHDKAKLFLEIALQYSTEYIISDQVYLEFYKLLRNPVLNTKPAKAKDASELIDFYRKKSGFLHCAFESRYMKDTLKHLSEDKFPVAKTFDLVLALTLAKNGVKTFYTRNVKDFKPFKLFEVINPVD